MSITVNEAINIKFNADMASLNKELTKAKVATAKATRSINKSLSSIKKTAAVVALSVGALTVAFGYLIYKGIQLNSELEDFRETSGRLSEELDKATIAGKAFVVAMSNPFYVALNAGVKETNRLIGEASPKAMDAMGKAFKTIAKGMVEIIAFVVKAVQQLIGVINIAWTGFKQLGNAAGIAGNYVGEQWNKLAVAVGNTVGLDTSEDLADMNRYTAALNERINLIGDIATETQGYADSVDSMNTSIDNVTSAITTAIDDGKSFSQVYEEAKKTLIEMGVEAPKAVKIASKATKEAVDNAADWVTELTAIGELYEDIGSEISGQFTNMFVDWQEGALDFGATMRNVLNNIAAQIFEMAVSKQIGGFITNLLGGFGGTTTTSLAGVDVSMFARGGVVNSPTIFPMASGVGLMGEAGAEAILPLTRMGGDLGVKAEASPVNVNVMNYGNDNVQVEQSDGNINVIISQIAQSISRGTGDIGNAIEGRYGIRKQ